MNLMACNNIYPGSFKLDGYIEGAKDAEKIMLYYDSYKNGEWIQTADTTEIRNGKFVFTGHIDELTSAGLVYEEHDIAVIDVDLYLEPTAMKLQINKNNPFAYILTGTKVEKENIELRKALEPYQKVDLENWLHLDNLRNRIFLNNENTLIRDSLNKEYDLHREKMRSVHLKMYETLLDFVSEHKTYRIVPNIIMRLPADTAQAIYNSLPEQSKSGLLGKLAHKRIEYNIEYEKSMQEFEENALVGRAAHDFTRQDAYGNTISLSGFKNKNCVLLDFWASWCRPCIANIPELINVYEQYSKQGLAFIGISIDSDSANWLNAIEAYKLDQWPQILSIPKEKIITVDYEDIGNMYNASRIPCYILIDKQGKIAARWEGSIDEEQLAEIDKIIN